MTLLTLYRETRLQLRQAGVEDAGGEAALLLVHVCGCRREALLTHGDKQEAEPAAVDTVQAAVRQRTAHRPLQYILGQWSFMDLQLQVGEGVLIPREDSAVLVAQAAKALAKLRVGGIPLLGVDLCAGTGAIGLALCKGCPWLEITAVEALDPAYQYLQRNLAAYPQYSVRPLHGDVLDAALPKAARLTDLDFIVSNPPYVSSCELADLQAEVQYEPKSALDGGRDGLLFYRAIMDIWTVQLKPGGFIALEIGETQAGQVCTLLEGAGIDHLQVSQDMAGLDRVVTGFRRTSLKNK